jgi:hypothetical protein
VISFLFLIRHSQEKEGREIRESFPSRAVRCGSAISLSIQKGIGLFACLRLFLRDCVEN